MATRVSKSMQRLGFSPFSLQRKIKAEHLIPMERAEKSSVSEKERREERKKYLKELNWIVKAARPYKS